MSLRILGDKVDNRLRSKLPGCTRHGKCVTNINLLRVTHGVPSLYMPSTTGTDCIINALHCRWMDKFAALCLQIKNRGVLVGLFIVQIIRMFFVRLTFYSNVNGQSPRWII